MKKNNIFLLIGLILVINSYIIAVNNYSSDVMTITPRYTQVELDSMRMCFIKEGNQHDFVTYIGYSNDEENRFMFTFYMANMYNNSYTQFEMYEMIREFYKNIGIEINSTASEIALSYLKRSFVQEHFSAGWEMSRLLLCGIGMTKDTIAAKEIIYKQCKKEKAGKIWLANNINYPKWYEKEKKEREEIQEERRMRIKYQAKLIDNLIDTTANNPSYTQDELNLLKDYFIEYGNQNAYTTYIKFFPDVENKAMYTFFMANTHNSAIAQYQMYCMIRDFYKSIGKDMDSTANDIAISYLKRSAEQGYYSAELELSRFTQHE